MAVGDVRVKDNDGSWVSIKGPQGDPGDAGSANAYGGKVQITEAGADTSVLPDGWTASRDAVGAYTVTHNLGMTNPDLVALATVVTGGGPYTTSITFSDATAFQVQVWTPSGPTQADAAFRFSLIVPDAAM